MPKGKAISKNDHNIYSYIDDQDPVYYNNTVSGNIVRSTDNGATWDNLTSIPTAEDIKAVTFWE